MRRTWGLRGAQGAARFNSPKSNKVRVVDLTPSVVAILAPLIAHQPATAWLWPSEPNSNNPLSPVRFHYRVWLTVMAASGLRYRKPHTLRHTYASLLLAQGVSMVYVKEQLGHHSIQITVDLYGHRLPQATRFVDQLDCLPSDITPTLPGTSGTIRESALIQDFASGACE